MGGQHLKNSGVKGLIIDVPNVVSSFTFLFDKPWKFWKQSRTFLANLKTIIEPALLHYNTDSIH